MPTSLGFDFESANRKIRIVGDLNFSAYNQSSLNLSFHSIVKSNWLFVVFLYFIHVDGFELSTHKYMRTPPQQVQKVPHSRPIIPKVYSKWIKTSITLQPEMSWKRTVWRTKLVLLMTTDDKIEEWSRNGVQFWEVESFLFARKNMCKNQAN